METAYLHRICWIVCSCICVSNLNSTYNKLNFFFLLLSFIYFLTLIPINSLDLNCYPKKNCLYRIHIEIGWILFKYIFHLVYESFFISYFIRNANIVKMDFSIFFRIPSFPLSFHSIFPLSSSSISLVS